MDEKRTVVAGMIAEIYAEELRYLDAMSDEARSTVGSVNDWSPKDVLAHVIHWDSMVAADLVRLDEPPPEQDEDYNRLNAEIWEQYKDISWEELEAFVDETNRTMTANLEQLSEDDFANPERFERLEGRPLWRSITLNNYYHALQHIAQLYAKQGELGYANQIQENAVKVQYRLSEEDDWLGSVHYNLGCHYAITGQADKALEQVKKGLDLYPTLKKWAPDDPDLILLHENAEFMALVEGD